ncbi:uncharacterized protein LOC134835884 isoform X3 [Culicoides brevitarsis]|uniref:uncharacterized protein LOC134835884 isoform X3 n=1 Tax=Culicoides brevitarsis TaxID=469753 RepID=UPI00307BBC99
MKFTNSTLVCLVISLCFALTSAQFFGGFPRSSSSLTQLTGDFGGPTAFSGFPSAGGGRDPRQNRGPVVFPPSPADAVDESSGVIVGASGFGFVPPQSQSKK